MLDFDYILSRMANEKLPASNTEEEKSAMIRTQIDPRCLRDTVFTGVLQDWFEKKPLRVFQVGAIESLETKFRTGSGWSELFWGEHIKEHGGDLHVCDINLNHIAHSHFSASNLGYRVNLHVGDAEGCLRAMFSEGDPTLPFDLYYLDGADEPHGNDQTLCQFKIIESHEALVMVDDVPTKGIKLLEHLDENLGGLLQTIEKIKKKENIFPANSNEFTVRIPSEDKSLNSCVIITFYNVGNMMMVIDGRTIK
mgnify:CR=1 FL=1|tara:strand:- start:682 stop:1437 length:756 start_codon:yes stop_codon:yes gene_type:complete